MGGKMRNYSKKIVWKLLWGTIVCLGLACTTVPVYRAIEVNTRNVTNPTLVTGETPKSSEMHPSVSWDGEKLVYVSNAYSDSKDNFDLIVLDLRNPKNPINLAPAPEPAFLPHWYPGSQYIIYTTIVRGTKLSEGKYTLYKIDVERGYKEEIEYVVASSYEELLYPYYGVASPDGKYLAIVTGGEGKKYPRRAKDWYIWYYKSYPNDKIFLLDLETKRAVFIVNGQWPAFSPDGKKLAYSQASSDKSCSIYIYDIDKGVSTVITTPRKNIRDIMPTFSLDGKEIAFVRIDETRNADIWKIGADGKNEVRLTLAKSRELFPSWGPGGWIYFQSNALDPNNWDIWKMKILY